MKAERNRIYFCPTNASLRYIRSQNYYKNWPCLHSPIKRTVFTWNAMQFVWISGTCSGEFCRAIAWSENSGQVFEWIIRNLFAHALRSAASFATFAEDAFHVYTLCVCYSDIYGAHIYIYKYIFICAIMPRWEYLRLCIPFELQHGWVYLWRCLPKREKFGMHHLRSGKRISRSKRLYVHNIFLLANAHMRNMPNCMWTRPCKAAISIIALLSNIIEFAS